MTGTPVFEEPSATGVRVLVVDDNEDAADVLADLLRSFGHEVAVAYDGPQALSMSAAFHPSVAVLDIGLPVMDGYELATKLRETEGRALRLYAVTGYGQADDLARSQAAGFDAHFVKPVDPLALEAVVRAPPPADP